MIDGSLGTWQVVPAPGLTDTGRIHTFQERTIERLQAMSEQYAGRTYEVLRQAVEESYTEGSGDLLKTLQYKVERDRSGVQVSFLAGTNHVVYLTALAGQPLMSPGHVIEAQPRGNLRFFWKNPPGGAPGVYSFHSVFWRTRVGYDVIASVLSAGAQDWEQAMIAEHQAAVVNFIQNDLSIDTRSPRVNVASGSGIPPQ